LIQQAAPKKVRISDFRGPQSKATLDLMRTIAIIFLLALIAVAGEVYSDRVLMSGSITVPVDPISRAVADSAH
jgi:hypothetical protein